MGSNDTPSSLALIDFAADDQIPQLVQNYYAYEGDTFVNSRLVLNDGSDNNMPFDDQHMSESGSCKCPDNTQHVQVHVSGHPETHQIYNGTRRISRNVDDDEDDPLLDVSPGADGAARDSLVDDPDHCHGPLPSTSNVRAQRQLIAACIVSVAFMIGEAVGGYLAQSLAIMTDAAHLLSDFASFLISIFALWVARRPATTRMSFGYYRAEVLGAVISVLIIWILTGVLCYLAVIRILKPDYEIKANIMLITAGAGVGINITLVIILQAGGIHLHSHGGGGHQHLPESSTDEEAEVEVAGGEENAHGHAHKQSHKEAKNINVRAAFIHVLGDLIQSVGVLIAAGIIKVNSDWKIADPICTFLFSILVLITTLTVLRDALNVLMEGVPRHINYPSLKEDLAKLPGVKMAHGLHVWSLTTSRAALAVHLAVDPEVNSEEVLQVASQMVRNKYGIHFSTIQVEHYQQDAMTKCDRCKGPC